jgi:hypothetical protein
VLNRLGWVAACAAMTVGGAVDLIYN